jgi:flagellar motor switch protein FliN/FliY
VRKTTLDPVTVAANSVARLLPSAGTLKATPHTGELSVIAPMTVVASFVGERSADLAIVVADAEQLVAAAAGTDSPLVSLIDVVRPALDAAGAALGVGVVGDVRIDDATALFADDDSAVFAIGTAATTAGYFVIRLRPESLRVTASPVSAQSMIGKLGRINNVEMALTVEIGRTRMSVRDLLGLEPGAVIELDRSAGAPADVLLNGRLIAHGEIVVVDQDYAVRITRILDVAEGLA